jgi:hypothetical protein
LVAFSRFQGIFAPANNARLAADDDLCGPYGAGLRTKRVKFGAPAGKSSWSRRHHALVEWVEV